jgi:LysM repeat protein
MKQLKLPKLSSGRKLSKREKTLLIVVICLTLIFVLNKFVLLPQMQQLSDSKMLLEQYTERSASNEQIKDSKTQIENRIKVREQELDEMKTSYFDSVEQEVAIWVINNSVQDTGLKLSALTFNRENPFAEGVDVEYLRVEVPFEGNYFDVVKFVDNIKKYEKEIIIEKLEVTVNDKKKIEGTIGLGFYSLAHVEKIIEGEVQIVEFNEETDPFRPFSATENGGLLEVIPEGFDINQIDIEPIKSKVLLEDFERADVKAVMGDTTGRCDFGLDANVTSGRNSLSVNYNFPLESLNRTFVVNLEKERIDVTRAAESYQLNVYSYAESDLTIKLRFLGADNRVYENTLASSIDWTGWKTLETSIESKYSIYPMRLQGIQIELGDSAVGSGEILMDTLVAVHTPPKVEVTHQDFDSGVAIYTVKKGDTLYSIAKSFGGDELMIEMIKEANHLKSNRIFVGKKLIIPPITIIEDAKKEFEKANGVDVDVLDALSEKTPEDMSSTEAIKASQDVLKGMAEKINEGDDITTDREKQQEVIEGIITDYMKSQNNN